MNVPELVIAAAFAALGVRAVVVWARRPFAGRDAADHALYALHLTGRIGLWFAFAGIFALFGTSGVRGQAFADEMEDQRWVLVVFVILGAMQLLGGWFLSRRHDADEP